MLLRATWIATPEEARAKLKKLYAKGELLSLSLMEDTFPATLRVKRPSATALNQDLKAVAAMVASFQRLKLTLNYATVNSRVMGEQRVPSSLSLPRLKSFSPLSANSGNGRALNPSMQR